MTVETRQHDSSASMREQGKTVTADAAGSARVNDVQGMLAKKIEDLEAQIQTSEHRTREVAKKHKRSLREVQRLVADKNQSPEDLIEALQQRTLAAINDAWRLEKQIPDLEAKADKMQRQNSACQAELEKGVVMRSKLQDLCRELQKQNKEVQQESRLYQEREEAKRNQLEVNLNKTVASITEKLDLHSEAATKQGEENAMLREQLQHLMDTVQASEAHSAQQVKMFDLQKQLWEAKGEQQTELAKKLEDRSNAYADKCESVVKENAVLSQELKTYHDQFQEFQGTLNRSNAMFVELRKQIKSSQVKERDLLQKNCSLQKQYEKTARSLLAATEENVALRTTNQKLSLANERLQSLCRTLRSSPKAGDVASSDELPDAAGTTQVDNADKGQTEP